jgi:hypothetical protein
LKYKFQKNIERMLNFDEFKLCVQNTFILDEEINVCIKDLDKNSCLWDTWTSANAAASGHLGCLKYLFENKCPWDEFAFSNAAANGHLGCLKYLFENKCPWDEFAFSNAAEHGHLECLKYLFENKCPWDEWTFYEAVKNGQLGCLEFLLEKKCPWNQKKCLEIAIEKQNQSIITFIKNLFKIKDQVTDNLKISTTCEICLTNKKCIAYEPCGHISSCHSCADQMKNCPHCREEILNRFVIIFS